MNTHHRIWPHFGRMALILPALYILEGCALPLVKAARNGDLNAVQALIRSGVNVNNACGVNLCGPTPLEAAALAGHLNVVKALIAAGADVNQISIKSGFVRDHGTALCWAAHESHWDVVKMLIDAGAVVNRLLKNSRFSIV